MEFQPLGSGAAKIPRRYAPRSLSAPPPRLQLQRRTHSASYPYNKDPSLSCLLLFLCHPIFLINPRRACAARVTVVVPCVCVCVCVCVCFQGLHLRLVQLSDKLGILVISVSCSLVFKFGVFRIIAFWRS